MDSVKEFLNYRFNITEDISFTVSGILIVIAALLITSLLLRAIRKLVTRRLPQNDKDKFKAVFSYFKWLIYLIIMLITFHAVGVM